MTQPRMTQPQGRSTGKLLDNGKPVSAGRRVGGFALMLVGVALIGFGAHYLAVNGNCSGTGYSSYGPVPHCGGGEPLYILSVFFLGPALAVVGWLLARAWGVLWPLVCVSLGAGLATIQLEKNSASGAKAFGLVAGVCLFALAVLSVVITVRKRLRPTAPVSPAYLGMTSGAVVPGRSGALPAMPGVPAVMDAAGPDLPPREVPRAASGPGPDPLDQIARLAQLRDSGALTEEEFQREKAKLLAQM